MALAFTSMTVGLSVRPDIRHRFFFHFLSAGFD